MRAGRLAALAAALVAAAPAAAQAAGPPGVTTGGVTDRTQTTVTLNGQVNPNGAATRYYFQIGVDARYGATTGVVAAGGGTNARKVSAPVIGLAPATTYHYRLIAENRFDIRRGADRTFTTRRVPLGLNLTPPSPVLFNSQTAIAGALTGTGNAGRTVALQTQPWPFTAAFATTGNAVVTDANGAFTFPSFALTVNTRARVVLADKPEVVSPEVLLQALPRVSTELKTKRYRRSKRVRFSGTVTPAIDGEQMQVQRLVGGAWEVVRTMRAKHRKGGASSKYEKSMLIRTTGRYRVVANITSGAYTSAPGREVKVKVKKRG